MLEPDPDGPIGGMPDQNSERAARIRALKDQRGWTFQRLADEVGVSKGTAESWVYKRVKPDWPNLARLAEVMGVTATWIETGENGDGDAKPADPVATVRHDVDRLRGRLTHLEHQIRFIAANTDRITQLEANDEKTIALVEQMASALMPLVTAQLQAAADRRASAAGPPALGERRTSPGRRRNDPLDD